MPSEKKQNYILEGIPKIGLFSLHDVSITSTDVEFGRWSFQFAILRSRNFCQHSSSKIPSFAHKNSIPFFKKKILANLKLLETKTSRLFIFFCLHVICRYMSYMESWSSLHRVGFKKKRMMYWMQPSALMLGRSSVLNS